MQDGDKRGVSKSHNISLEMMSTWDNQEDLPVIGAGDIDLTSGVLGDNSGNGDGTSRAVYYARAFHNYDQSTDATVAYRLVGDTTQVRKISIPAMNDRNVWGNIATILGTGSGTTAGTYLKVWYKEKLIVLGSGESRGN